LLIRALAAMPNVDVAICVYGKPYQTVATLASLFHHCGQHIGRVFIQEEKQQPFREQVDYIRDVFPEKDIYQYIPPGFLSTFWLAEPNLYLYESIRRSIRYQIAWEMSESNYLFISHNDVLFSGDTIGQMMAAMGDEYTGAGIVGQCWNCPANYASLCSGDHHETFNPTYDETIELLRAYPSPRLRPEFVDREQPMPLLECRLGEFACLINLKKSRPLVRPVGSVVPFGWYTHDTGVEWFRQMRLRGHRFKNIAPDFKHAPFLRTGNGNDALNNSDIYQQGENAARFWLGFHYPDDHARLESLRKERGMPVPYEDGYMM
jgi:hypothetical protein